MADILPEGEPTALAQWRRDTRAHYANLREKVRNLRDAPTAHGMEKPDWAAYEKRLFELGALAATLKNKADLDLLLELEQDFYLDFQGAIATAKAELQGKLVAAVDGIVADLEKKKFEMGSEHWNELEDFFLPYKDEMREAMLSELPLEQRREVEEAKRRREEEGAGPA